MVNSKPSISNSALWIFWTLLIVFNNFPNPSSAKYSHWIGIIILSAAVNALRVSNPKEGAQSVIYACLKDDLNSGDYIGPDGMRGWSGKPKHAMLSSEAKNPELRKRLWDLSCELTKMSY